MRQALFKAGLAKLNPLEGSKIRKKSPDSRTCVHMYRNGRGVELKRMPVLTNTTFVLLLCNKVAIYCSVSLLHYIC